MINVKKFSNIENAFLKMTAGAIDDELQGGFKTLNPGRECVIIRMLSFPIWQQKGGA